MCMPAKFLIIVKTFKVWKYVIFFFVDSIGYVPYTFNWFFRYSTTGKKMRKIAITLEKEREMEVEAETEFCAISKKSSYFQSNLIWHNQVTILGFMSNVMSYVTARDCSLVFILHKDGNVLVEIPQNMITVWQPLVMIKLVMVTI